MRVGAAGMVDNFTVQMGADQAYLVAVFPGGKADGGPHHAGAYDSYNAHSQKLLSFAAQTAADLQVISIKISVP